MDNNQPNNIQNTGYGPQGQPGPQGYGPGNQPYGPQGGWGPQAAPQGYNPGYQPSVAGVKSATVAGLLGIFLGQFGAHNWYLGEKKKGIIHVSLFAGGIIINLLASILLPELLSWRTLLTISWLITILGILAWLVLVGNGIWGLVEGIIILSQGDAGLAQKGYPVAVPAYPAGGYGPQTPQGQGYGPQSYGPGNQPYGPQGYGPQGGWQPQGPAEPQPSTDGHANHAAHKEHHDAAK